MPPLLLALVVLAAGPAAPRAAPAPGTPAAPPPSADPLERRRAEIAEEMVALGLRIQRDIEAGDVAALLARVPPEGLRCAGEVVPRARVERQLREADSWLHRTLFGAPGEGAGGRAPASLRAFFAAAPEIAVLVAFRRDARAGPLGRPCIEFRARDLAPPLAPFCFEARGGSWWFTESLYPCD